MANKNYSPARRKRKAYTTAFVVFGSYLWLRLKSKLFGPTYYQKRINGLHEKNAKRIQKRVQELQGLFIKVGQLISNLSNVLPAEFRTPLESLQDHIDAKPFAEVRQTIEKELGKGPKELFSHFEEVPIAAASIGQVHRARIGAEEVVVKVQHANIPKIAKADLEILRRLVKLHAFFMDMKGLHHTYEQVSQMIEEELDFTKEAASMQQIAKNLEDAPELRIKIPTVFEDFSTSRVLVSSFCEGVKIGDLVEMNAWEIDLEDVSKRLIELYCKMVLVDGFYHADPHPGNILINKTGEIVLLDFGAVAHISSNMRNAIPELIEAIVRNDTEATVAALRKMGFLGSDKASRKFVEDLIDLFREFLQEEVEFDGMNFQNIKLNSGLGSIASLVSKVDLREVSNSIRVPKDYILLNRTVVLLLGNSFRLAPELNTLDVIRPYVKKHVLKENGNLSQLVINTLKTQLTTAISLPNELARFLKTANRGELEYEIKGLEDGLSRLHRLGQQFLYTFLTAISIYFLLSYSLTYTTFWKNVNIGFIGLFSLLLLRSFFRTK